jgi:hypothetical protein
VVGIRVRETFSNQVEADWQECNEEAVILSGKPGSNFVENTKISVYFMLL